MVTSANVPAIVSLSGSRGITITSGAGLRNERAGQRVRPVVKPAAALNTASLVDSVIFTPGVLLST